MYTLHSVTAWYLFICKHHFLKHHFTFFKNSNSSAPFCSLSTFSYSFFIYSKVFANDRDKYIIGKWIIFFDLWCYYLIDDFYNSELYNLILALWNLILHAVSKKEIVFCSETYQNVDFQCVSWRIPPWVLFCQDWRTVDGSNISLPS